MRPEEDLNVQELIALLQGTLTGFHWLQFKWLCRGLCWKGSSLAGWRLLEHGYTVKYISNIRPSLDFDDCTAAETKQIICCSKNTSEADCLQMGERATSDNILTLFSRHYPKFTCENSLSEAKPAQPFSRFHTAAHNFNNCLFFFFCTRLHSYLIIFIINKWAGD